MRLYMLILTGLYVIIAGVFAVRTPDWQTPDEPAHYSYIAQVAAGEIPVIAPSDWDSVALDAYKAARFDGVTQADIRAIEYEDHQPPLYYIVSAPVYALTDGNLTALRLVSMLWGVVILWSAYGVTRLLYPEREGLAVAAAGFVAFQPMHLHILASVNNDSLAWAIVGVGLFLSVAHAKGEKVAGRCVPTWLLGVVVGIGLITKATTYFMAGIAGLAIVIHWWHSTERTPAAFIRRVALYLVPALTLGLLWWLRNISVYGMPDFLGLAAHDAVVVGQPRTAERIDALGFGGYLREIMRTTFNSFWGQFGWMALPLRESWYAVITAGLAVAVAGLGVGWWRKPQEHERHPAQIATWGLLLLTMVLAVLAYAYYNSEFQQYQGRYMFTLLIPLGILLALGVDAWRRLLLQERLPWLTALVPGLLLLFDLYLIWRVIPPGLAP
jgi:4-amino-4-deoxy-L-arabinose transferase-like glycosyltransferase